MSVLDALASHYGSHTWHWSPDYVRGPMDVIAGAVLVQHTTWTNAERALDALRAAGMLDPQRIIDASDEELMALVRMSGTPTVKARRLRAIARTIVEWGGLGAMLSLPPEELRARLLATHGVGPETADSIALYAAGHRSFVIDAYTVRLFSRLGIGPARGSYDAWQRFFHAALPDDGAPEFQRHHAHIVLHAKALCRAKPRCGACPLASACRFAMADRP